MPASAPGATPAPVDLPSSEAPRSTTTQLIDSNAPPATNASGQIASSPRLTSQEFAAAPSAGLAARVDTTRTGTVTTLAQPVPAATAAAAAHAIDAAHASKQSDLAKSSPAAATPVTVPAPVAQIWRIELGDRTLRTALTRWAHTAGWQLIWDAPVDFSVDAEASVEGSFDDALHEVIASLAHSNTPIQAIVYQGNKVIRIIQKGAA
jgi:hypothetical protein